MVNIRVRDHQKAMDSPKTEVGEIDTRAPFQSVKAAVSLFGEVAISRQKSTARRSRNSPENVLDKETQLMLAQREFGKIKQRLESAEGTKTRALADLEKAKRTMTELRNKLEKVNESKQSATEAKKAVMQREGQLEHEKSLGPAHPQELEAAREQYLTNTIELDAAKQELNKIRQDYDSAMEAKMAALHQAAEAQCMAGFNSERVNELSKEISEMKEAIRQLEFATSHNKQDYETFVQEKDKLQQCYRGTVEDAEKKLQVLKQEYDPELARETEAKLAEATSEIEALRAEMKKAHDTEMSNIRLITDELNEATMTLKEAADEECKLRSLVNSLRMELEDVRREHAVLKEKEAQRLAIEEQKRLEANKEESLKQLEQILSEAENARKEAEEMNRNAEILKKEAESAWLAAQEAEKKLETVQRVVEEAKAAEKRIRDKMQSLSENHESKKEESSASKIKITLQEFESLKRSVEESEAIVKIKQADVAAQLEEISKSKYEADKKLEENLKALEEIKSATDMAVKGAEMSEAAQRAVEAELQKWRQQEQVADS